MTEDELKRVICFLYSTLFVLTMVIIGLYKCEVIQ